MLVELGGDGPTALQQLGRRTDLLLSEDLGLDRDVAGERRPDRPAAGVERVGRLGRRGGSLRVAVLGGQRPSQEDHGLGVIAALAGPGKRIASLLRGGARLGGETGDQQHLTTIGRQHGHQAVRVAELVVGDLGPIEGGEGGGDVARPGQREAEVVGGHGGQHRQVELAGEPLARFEVASRGGHVAQIGVEGAAIEVQPGGGRLVAGRLQHRQRRLERVQRLIEPAVALEQHAVDHLHRPDGGASRQLERTADGRHGSDGVTETVERCGPTRVRVRLDVDQRRRRGHLDGMVVGDDGTVEVARLVEGQPLDPRREGSDVGAVVGCERLACTAQRRLRIAVPLLGQCSQPCSIPATGHPADARDLWYPERVGGIFTLGRLCPTTARSGAVSMNETPKNGSSTPEEQPPPSTYEAAEPARRDPLLDRPPWLVGDFGSFQREPVELPDVAARPDRVSRHVREGEQWSDDVTFAADGTAFRAGEIITTGGARAWQYLSARVDGPVDQRPATAARAAQQVTRLNRLPNIGGRLRVRVDGLADPRPLIRELAAEGFVAQVNHVYFACCTCGCCPPHPSVLGCGAGGAAATPVHRTPVHATPVHATPVHATPVHATPVHATPVHATGAGWDRSTAEAVPGDEPEVETLVGRFGLAQGPPAAPANAGGPTVVVLDTGMASDSVAPASLGAVTFGSDNEALDVPDSNDDQQLDTVAGHGTFIAGLIRSIAPDASISVRSVIPPQGDLDEAHIVDLLDELVRIIDESEADPTAPVPVQILSLSFCGYSEDYPAAFAEALAFLQARGVVVVASAGNDADCRPMFPASLPGVVSVGAIGPDGPAPFTNYGPWVRACAPGVGLVSTFFQGWNGSEAADPDGDDPDAYQGWARWSGTSFSAPVVVGVLARQIGERFTSVDAAAAAAAEAVARIIDHPSLLRIPNLGTVVNQI